MKASVSKIRALPSSSPDSAGGGCVDAQRLICSSHTGPCCHCPGPGDRQTFTDQSRKLASLFCLHAKHGTLVLQMPICPSDVH